MGAAVRVAGEVENARGEVRRDRVEMYVPCLFLSVVQRARVSVASVV